GIILIEGIAGKELLALVRTILVDDAGDHFALSAGGASLPVALHGLPGPFHEIARLGVVAVIGIAGQELFALVGPIFSHLSRHQMSLAAGRADLAVTGQRRDLGLLPGRIAA